MAFLSAIGLTSWTAYSMHCTMHYLNEGWREDGDAPGKRGCFKLNRVAQSGSKVLKITFLVPASSNTTCSFLTWLMS